MHRYGIWDPTGLRLACYYMILIFNGVERQHPVPFTLVCTWRSEGDDESRRSLRGRLWLKYRHRQDSSTSVDSVSIYGQQVCIEPDGRFQRYPYTYSFIFIPQTSDSTMIVDHGIININRLRYHFATVCERKTI